MEHLNGKTRILVTHQLHFLQYADYIILVDNGEIAEQGRYEELIQNQDSKLKEILATYSLDETAPKQREEVPSREINKELTAFEEEEKKRKAKLIRAEERSRGMVKFKIVWTYAKFGGGIFFIVLTLFLFSINQV
jgi:ABC-type glutathione transport system ATPase component